MEQIFDQMTTVPDQLRKSSKNDRKTMLQKQALARYGALVFNQTI